MRLVIIDLIEILPRLALPWQDQDLHNSILPKSKE